MTHKAPPKRGFITTLRRLSRKGETRWVDPRSNRLYTWDALHGELEVFTRHGHHLGAVDPLSGRLVKPPVKGRKLDV